MLSSELGSSKINCRGAAVVTNDDPEQPEGPAEAFKEIERKALAAQRDALDQADRYGYFANTARYMATVYTGLEDAGLPLAVQGQLISSGHTFCRAMSMALDPIVNASKQLSASLDTAVITFASAATTADMSCAVYSPETNWPRPRPCPFLPDSQERECVEKLTQLDPSLGSTYVTALRGYRTREVDSGKSALFMLRQTYDHLFRLLAPDEKVRESGYWTRKQGDKPNAVHRRERLAYAAAVHIGDPAARLALTEAADITLEAYDALNAAHSAGPLEAARMCAAFEKMDELLGQWIRSLQPWPPRFDR